MLKPPSKQGEEVSPVLVARERQTNDDALVLAVDAKGMPADKKEPRAVSSKVYVGFAPECQTWFESCFFASHLHEKSRPEAVARGKAVCCLKTGMPKARMMARPSVQLQAHWCSAGWNCLRVMLGARARKGVSNGVLMSCVGQCIIFGGPESLCCQWPPLLI